jgi:copper(I)-binding protein
MRSRTLLLVALVGCVALLNPIAHADQPALGIQVTHAWIRWLPQNLPAGGYMTLINTSGARRVLIGASSADYGEVSFHQTQTANGTSTMMPLDSIAIAPHASVHFSPGGYHIMLMRPTHSLHPGDKVSMSLRFAGGQTLDIEFKVRSAAAGDAESSADIPNMPGMR